MITVKAKLRPSSVPGNPGSIVYAIACNGKVKHHTTAYKLFPSEWDAKQGAVIQSSDSERARACRLIAQRMRWDLACLQCIAADMDANAASLDVVLMEFVKQANRQSFFRYMSVQISRLRLLGRSGTAGNYQTALNSFSAFRENEDLRFEELTADVVEEYEAWLHSRGVSPNSSSFYMRQLRAVLRKAVDDGIAADATPFRRVFTGVAKTRKRAISLDDIRKIRNLDLEMKPSLALWRDMFLFQFYAMGISFVDAAFLRKTDLSGGEIRYRRRKTRQLITVPINSHLQEIINRYASPNSPYLLPIISKPGENELAQYDTALRSANAHLKKIAELAGISATLTTYVSRHSWASIAKSKGISVATISDALGHDSVTTTQIYLQTIDTAELYRANSIILSDL